MEQVTTAGGGRLNDIRTNDALSAGRSAASWPAIFAGAFVTISVSLVLVALGSGLGFASVSPWTGHGVSATTFTVTAAIWLIVTQWLSAALGGYIAGRLRTKWVGTHTHEVFFRDTAHGFITWAVATVFVFAVLAGSASSLIHGGMHALGGAAAGGASMAGPMMGPPPGGSAAESAGGPPESSSMPAEPSAALTYDVDKLFRPATETASAGAAGPATTPASDSATDPRIEAVYIAFHAMVTGSVPEADRTYLASRVAAQTAIPQAQAERRVDSFVEETLAVQVRAKAAADKARKAAAETSIYLALSMLIGAFIASVSAALGGRLRDEHP
jgi:hypothetical protein